MRLSSFLCAPLDCGKVFRKDGTQIEHGLLAELETWLLEAGMNEENSNVRRLGNQNHDLETTPHHLCRDPLSAWLCVLSNVS